jgi:hypothetical protein
MVAQKTQIMDYYKALKTNVLFTLLAGLGQFDAWETYRFGLS